MLKTDSKIKRESDKCTPPTTSFEFRSRSCRDNLHSDVQVSEELISHSGHKGTVDLPSVDDASTRPATDPPTAKPESGCASRDRVV
jgi:hypothetical protein